jgi:hypothetical protein
MLGEDFQADPQGRRYADVLAMPSFALVLAFFDDRGRQRRMIESEEHHDRPALAGVIKEFEKSGVMKELFDWLSPKESVRVRQAVGVVVRLVMNKHGWIQTGKRGSLTGLSKWFTRSERYEYVTFE